MADEVVKTVAVEANESAQRAKKDPELVAMDKIRLILDTLSGDEQQRVLSWAFSRVTGKLKAELERAMQNSDKRLIDSQHRIGAAGGMALRGMAIDPMPGSF